MHPLQHRKIVSCVPLIGINISAIVLLSLVMLTM